MTKPGPKAKLQNGHPRTFKFGPTIAKTWIVDDRIDAIIEAEKKRLGAKTYSDVIRQLLAATPSGKRIMNA